MRIISMIYIRIASVMGYALCSLPYFTINPKGYVILSVECFTEININTQDRIIFCKAFIFDDGKKKTYFLEHLFTFKGQHY